MQQHRLARAGGADDEHRVGLAADGRGLIAGLRAPTAHDERRDRGAERQQQQQQRTEREAGRLHCARVREAG
jgi:hypothetical protein